VHHTVTVQVREPRQDLLRVPHGEFLVQCAYMYAHIDRHRQRHRHTHDIYSHTYIRMCIHKQIIYTHIDKSYIHRDKSYIIYPHIDQSFIHTKTLDPFSHPHKKTHCRLQLSAYSARGGVQRAKERKTIEKVDREKRVKRVTRVTRMQRQDSQPHMPQTENDKTRPDATWKR
jgi:hypothetical protein